MGRTAKEGRRCRQRYRPIGRNVQNDENVCRKNLFSVLILGQNFFFSSLPSDFLTYPVFVSLSPSFLVLWSFPVSPRLSGPYRSFLVLPGSSKSFPVLPILRQFSSRNHAVDIPISSGGEGGKIRQRADAPLSPPEETQLVYLQLKKKFES